MVQKLPIRAEYFFSDDINNIIHSGFPQVRQDLGTSEGMGPLQSVVSFQVIFNHLHQIGSEVSAESCKSLYYGW